MSESKSKNKVAIVTGASSGIGEATARCLAEAGYTVVLAARRKDLLERIVSEIEDAGGRALAVAADLSDGEDTSALVRKTLESYGRVDALVNNAGYGPPYALEQMSREQLRHVFDVNLLAAMQLIGELTPVMRKQGGGRIVNVSSLTRYVGAPMAASYAATKGGMEAMNACMRLELAPFKIQLSVIVPGFVDTPTFDKSREAGAHLRDDPDNPYRDLMEHLDEFAKDQLKSAIPPEDVAAIVLKVLEARRPKPRYFAPKSARNAVRIFGMMPEKAAEHILQRMYRWGPPG